MIRILAILVLFLITINTVGAVDYIQFYDENGIERTGIMKSISCGACASGSATSIFWIDTGTMMVNNKTVAWDVNITRDLHVMDDLTVHDDLWVYDGITILGGTDFYEEITGRKSIVALLNISGDYAIGTIGVCIAGDCRAVWPAGGSGKYGGSPYLYNDSTTIYVNETEFNKSVFYTTQYWWTGGSGAYLVPGSVGYPSIALPGCIYHKNDIGSKICFTDGGMDIYGDGEKIITIDEDQGKIIINEDDDGNDFEIQDTDGNQMFLGDVSESMNYVTNITANIICLDDTCRDDWPAGGGGGTGSSKWIDGGNYVYPNSSFGDHISVGPSADDSFVYFRDDTRTDEWLKFDWAQDRFEFSDYVYVYGSLGASSSIYGSSLSSGSYVSGSDFSSDNTYSGNPEVSESGFYACWDSDAPESPANGYLTFGETDCSGGEEPP